VSPTEVAAVGLDYARSAQPAAQTVGRDFEALLLKLLWETARIPASPSRASSAGPARDVFAGLLVDALAASHSLDFGSMVLPSIVERPDGGGAYVWQR